MVAHPKGSSSSSIDGSSSSRCLHLLIASRYLLSIQPIYPVNSEDIASYSLGFRGELVLSRILIHHLTASSRQPAAASSLAVQSFSIWIRMKLNRVEAICTGTTLATSHKAPLLFSAGAIQLSAESETNQCSHNHSHTSALSLRLNMLIQQQQQQQQKPLDLVY